VALEKISKKVAYEAAFFALVLPDFDLLPVD
jgi:hypothetical protein